jgi:hypothetical protein
LRLKIFSAFEAAAAQNLLLIGSLASKYEVGSVVLSVNAGAFVKNIA